MKASTLFASVVAFLVGASITLAIVRWFNIGEPEIALGVGAILGIQAAAFLHHRTNGSSNTVGIKFLLGSVLATTAILFGLAIHAMFAPFKFADISIAISAIGVFIFPFVIFNTFWSALSKSKAANVHENH